MRFIRVHGRVVPVKDKKSESAYATRMRASKYATAGLVSGVVAVGAFKKEVKTALKQRSEINIAHHFAKEVRRIDAMPGMPDHLKEQVGGFAKKSAQEHMKTGMALGAKGVKIMRVRQLATAGYLIGLGAAVGTALKARKMKANGK